MTLFLAALAISGNEAVFTSSVRPVLEARCAQCHGGAQPAGGLKADSLASLLSGGKHGAAIVPGKAGSSLIVKYVRGEANPRMPLGAAPLTAGEIDGLVKAIDSMSPVAAKSRDAHFEWLFAKPVRPSVPAGAAHPVDAFVRARLAAKNLQPAARADRRALLRRVYFDLIGLPPTPEEAAAFIKDDAPDAVSKLVDRLLDDPRYGERWARHWLDLVRFAESDGFAIDGERPTAWRYRDYVIRSFNSDKPYDVFIKEQLAGDERGEGDRSENLVALGFQRMATWEADANFKTQLRQDFLNEVTATASSVFLGMTAGCARCHDHKYDPIPTRDFYRLQAFFAATRIEDRPAAFTKAEDPERQGKQLLRRLEDDAEEAQAAFAKVEARFKQLYASRKNLKPGDKAVNEYVRVLRDKRDATFTAEERREFTEARDHARRLGELPARHRPLAYSVSDVVPPHVPAVADTYVLLGGDLMAKGEKVDPGYLSAVTGNGDAAKIPFAGGSSGRRKALAEWIASGDNPLTSRVMVNRIWQHHFGEGIVRTPSDFGRNGERPAHPELLDWLAHEFVEKKWSIKAMHRLMLNSETYQQSTAHAEANRYSGVDPDNRLLWRANWMRLESETIRDTMLAAAGELRRSSGGPGSFLDIAPDVAEGFEFFKWFPSPEEKQNVRSIYTFQRRSVVQPMMEVFDVANMSESCARRNTTVVPPQAFALLNSKFARGMARRLAERAAEQAGNDRALQVERAFELALSRKPSETERARARELEPEQLALVLFNLNEFLYLE